MFNALILSARNMKSGVAKLLTVSVLALSISGCDGGADDGTVVNTVQLPTDYLLNLYCPNVGVAAEECVLFDPENPYARAAVNDDTKWDLASQAPSAKSRFYSWATAQANQPRGENQYYTALSLHQLYSEGGSELARDQAKAAYKSVLDNYFGSVTFFEIPSPTGPVLLPQSLRELVGDNLVSPANAGLSQLYDSSGHALDAIGVWGYFYDEDTGLISKNF